MKRFLPIIPIFLLVLLNACGNPAPPKISDNTKNAVVQTLTAEAWTPIPSPTFNPNILNIVTWFNSDLPTANPLEWTLDAEYHVDNVSFINVKEIQGLVFRVDVRCECVNSDECCIPERIFVVIVNSMKRSPSILTQVPEDVTQMWVVCSDHKKPLGARTASWKDVKDYLSGSLTGYQLGVRVTQTVLP